MAFVRPHGKGKVATAVPSTSGGSSGGGAIVTPTPPSPPTPPTPPALTITTTSLAGGTVGEAYSRTIAASGGVAPRTFAVHSGALPDGLSLSSSGVLSGTLTMASAFAFTVRATGHDGSTDDQAYSVTIVEATDATAQHPELLALTGVNHRPSAIAGVTFRIGPDPVGAFKLTDHDALPSGWAARTDIWWIYSTGDNPAALDGWDFTPEGWTVRILHKGAVVTNNDLTPRANGVGGAIQALTLDSKPIPGDVTINNNRIDGAKVSTGPGGLINVSAYGTVNIRENYGLNAYDDFIDFAIQTPGDTTALNIVDNHCYNIGYGTGRDSDGNPTDDAHQVHADWIQVYHWDVGYGRILSGTVTGNVLAMVDDTPHAIGAERPTIHERLNAVQGLFLQQAFWHDLDVRNNSFFTPLSDPIYGESVLHGIFVDTGRINGTFTVGGNYALMAGVSNFHEIGSTLGGTDTPTIVQTSDINMTTGAAIP